MSSAGKKKKKSLLSEQNMIEEPLAEYFKSDAYAASFKTLTFSSVEEQEEENYKYWRSLTPEQRLELHYLFLVHVYFEEIEKNKNIPINEIVFSHDDIS